MLKAFHIFLISIINDIQHFDPAWYWPCFTCFKLHYMQNSWFYYFQLIWFGYRKSPLQNTDFSQNLAPIVYSIVTGACVIYFYSQNGCQHVFKQEQWQQPFLFTQHSPRWHPPGHTFVLPVYTYVCWIKCHNEVKSFWWFIISVIMFSFEQECHAVFFNMRTSLITTTIPRMWCHSKTYF